MPVVVPQDAKLHRADGHTERVRRLLNSSLYATEQARPWHRKATLIPPRRTLLEDEVLERVEWDRQSVSRTFMRRGMQLRTILSPFPPFRLISSSATESHYVDELPLSHIVHWPRRQQFPLGDPVMTTQG